MTSTVVPCTCSSACQADSTCGRRPCFQAHLDAVQDAQHPRIHRRTEACADHLGTMVVAMTTWAREQDLINADLTILAIEPPPCEGYSRQQQQRDCAQTSGLVFSIIHLGEPKSVPADMRPAAPGTDERGSSAPPARTDGDQLLHLSLSAVGGSPVRALLWPNVARWLM